MHLHGFRLYGGLIHIEELHLFVIEKLPIIPNIFEEGCEVLFSMVGQSGEHVRLVGGEEARREIGCGIVLNCMSRTHDIQLHWRRNLHEHRGIGRGGMRSTRTRWRACHQDRDRGP